MEEPPVASWAGPYAGVSLGYGFSGTTTPATGDVDTDGFLGGVFAGYNLQNGMFVYGIEGDVGYSGVKGDNGITETKSGFEGRCAPASALRSPTTSCSTPRPAAPPSV